MSLAGLYMMTVRGTVGSTLAHVGQGIDACLIMICAVLAARHAMARNYSTHRRWALRLYLVVSASLFVRAGAFIAGTLTDAGTVLTVMSFAQYVVLLGVLEMYLRVRPASSAAHRFAVAGTLAVCTVVLAAGLLGATAGKWRPDLRAAFDSRRPIGGVQRRRQSERRGELPGIVAPEFAQHQRRFDAQKACEPTRATVRTPRSR